MLDNFFFVGLPYIALLLFVGGTLYRAFTGVLYQYRGKRTWSVRGDLLWTTRSTGFFGRASIGPAALCLHWGLFLVLLGHLVGFVGGALGWVAWVNFFRWVGMAGGVLLFYGVSWALVRRLSVPALRAMSTAEDLVVLVFLVVLTGLGLYHSMVQLAWGVSYAVGPWLVGLLTFQPDASLLKATPLTVKLHMIAGLLFFAYFPFTKLVHALSFPFDYAVRPYISMRSYVGLKR